MQAPWSGLPSLSPGEAPAHRVALPPSWPLVLPNTATAGVQQEFQKANFCCPHTESSLIHIQPWPFIYRQLAWSNV